MLAAPTSLLRLLSIASGRLVLVVFALIALSAPAVATGAAPDPSPSGEAVAPDPYRPASTPVHVVVVPQAPVRSSAPAAPAVVRKPVRSAPHSKPRATVAVPPTRTVIPIRRPAGPAPTVAARFVGAVNPGRHISTALALAVAGLVLLSGALVAGAAREVAR